MIFGDGNAGDCASLVPGEVLATEPGASTGSTVIN